MVAFSAVQIAILERLRQRGFTLVAFPMYENHVGVRLGDCAALVAPIAVGFSIYGEPCCLVGGHLSVRVTRDGLGWFVWKKQRVEATPERLAELGSFCAELTQSLLPLT